MAKSGKPNPKISKKTASRQTEKQGATPHEDQLQRDALPLPANERWQKAFWIMAGLALVLMLFMSLKSGINADDKFQTDYSTKLVHYYSSFGKDTSALNIPDGNMHLYGGFFEVITGFTNSALGYTDADLGYHNVRHLFSSFFGWIAILCAALLARYIAGWRAGLFTLVIMFLSPRFLGDSFMNPKDIPFAAGYMMALYNMAVVLDGLPKPKRWNIVGLVAGLAIALAIRAGGLLPFAFLFMFGGLHLIMRHGFGQLFNGKTFGRYALVIGGTVVAGYVLAILFWPYALQSPLKNPFLALSKFSDLEVKIRVLFEGTNMMSDKTPWYYPVKWILYTIPLAAIVGFFGSLVLFRRLARNYNPLWVFLAIFGAAFPVLYIIYKHSVIHDGWRHLTFCYPPMVVAAGLFWNELSRIFEEKKSLQYAVYGALALTVADPAYFIAANSAYPYVYFNPIAGGEKGAFGKYETDYWGISVRQGLEWMEDQGIIGNDMKQPVVIATNMYYSAKCLAAKYGDNVKIKYLKWDRRCDDAWDYALFPTRFIDGATLQAGYWPPDNAIHVVEANGVPLLAVLKDNGKNCSLGIASMKLGDSNNAIAFLKKEVENVPDNDLAWTNLAQAYMNLGQLDDGKAAAEQALKINPDDAMANNLVGIYWLQKNDAVKAREQFDLALKREPSNAAAYYYLALIAQSSGDAQTALSNLMKAIQTAPNFKPAYELSAKIYESQGNTSAAQQFRSAMQQIK